MKHRLYIKSKTALFTIGVGLVLCASLVLTISNTNKRFLSSEGSLTHSSSIDTSKKNATTTSFDKMYLFDDVGMNTPINSPSTLSPRDKIVIKDFEKLVKKVLEGEKIDGHKMDLITQHLIFSETIPREDKIQLFSNAIEESELGFKYYLIDVFANLYPYEASDALIEAFQSSDSAIIKNNILDVLKDTQLATSLGDMEFNSETLEEYLDHQRNIQSFYREAIAHLDPDVQKQAIFNAPSVLEPYEVTEILNGPHVETLNLSNTDRASTLAQVALVDTQNIDQGMRNLSALIHASALEEENKNGLNYVMSQVITHYKENLSYASPEARYELSSAIASIEPVVLQTDNINGVIQYRNWFNTYANLTFNGDVSYEEHLNQLYLSVNDSIKQDIIANDFMPL